MHDDLKAQVIDVEGDRAIDVDDDVAHGDGGQRVLLTQVRVDVLEVMAAAPPGQAHCRSAEAPLTPSPTVPTVRVLGSLLVLGSPVARARVRPICRCGQSVGTLEAAITPGALASALQPRPLSLDVGGGVGDRLPAGRVGVDVARLERLLAGRDFTDRAEGDDELGRALGVALANGGAELPGGLAAGGEPLDLRVVDGTRDRRRLELA